MAQPVTRYTKLFLGANVVLAAFLLVGVTGRFLGPGQSRNGGEPVFALVTAQAQSAARLFKAELESVRQETRAAAELATHIFSNPESYRLAAQPGEYDYDQATGLYGSVRNDGSSVAFLSASNSLTPEILREIRLSEYLNPIFRTSASLNPLVRTISLYTNDGLVRSYPWFDFKGRVASGTLKRNFSAPDLPFFARAAPSRNASRQGVWEVFDGGSKHGETQLLCAAPFLAGESFRGVVAVEVDVGKLASQVFKNLEPREALGLLLAVNGRVLGTSRKAESNVTLSGVLPDVLRNLKVSGLAGLEPLLLRLATVESFAGGEAGFHLAVAESGSLPVKPVLIVPEALARADRSLQGAPALPVWLLIETILACGLLLVDAWWVTKTQRSLAESDKKLSESFTALSDLNLQSALTVGPQAMVSDLYPRLDEGLDSIQKALEAGPMEALPEEVGVVPRAALDLKQIEHGAAVFSAFDAIDPARQNLNRLATALRNTFEMRLVSFFSYSDSVFRMLPQSVSGSAEEAVIDWKAGNLFDALNTSKGVASSSRLTLSLEEQQLLSPFIQGSYLALPLLDDQRLVGSVVLSGGTSEVSTEHEALLEALQGVLSRTVQNIYQCDVLSKLNQVRRDYCLELAKAVEAPLDRIRTEVQSIYTRLGKLTPYYKQHCETILFEVGKLYEMLREARETETAAEPKSEEHATSPEDALTTIQRKGEG